MGKYPPSSSWPPPGKPSAASRAEFAHAVGSLEDLRSIATEGLRPMSSVEVASRPVYATDTYRIIFSGEALGGEVARSFAPDLPFIQTWETVLPSRIARIEVDVYNLSKPAPTTDELAKIYEDAVAEYGEDNIPPLVWKEIERKSELHAEVYIFGREVTTQANYKEMVRKALSGTPAANAPIVPLYITE